MRMGKRLCLKERKRLEELDLYGLTVDNVSGTEKASSLFLCLTKSLIIFMVCFGTVAGFADAFSLNYNKGTLMLFTLLASALISLLYVRKKFFYIGYFVLLILFTVELMRYYLYANSGFQAIMNTVREAYGDFFSMTVVRKAEEHFANRNLTITIALIFITVFLIIMYNITVSRYMNFAETFGISFIILEIPMYIGYKPPVYAIVLILAGTVCTGVLQKGAFNRVTVPGKNSPDYIKDKLFKTFHYTTRGSSKGILIAIGFSLVFSLAVILPGLPVIDRSIGETEENSAKSAIDDYVKIFIQNGFYGFFNRYDSLNGLSRGALGGVSSVNPDFRTDIVVRYVPYDEGTLYLRGFKGIGYKGMNWTPYATYYQDDAKRLFSSTQDSGITLSSDMVTEMDEAYERALYGENTDAFMHIDYVDESFGMAVIPYFTQTKDMTEGAKSTDIPKNGDDPVAVILDSYDIQFRPLVMKNGLYEVLGNEISLSEREAVSSAFSWKDEKGEIEYNNYINGVCRFVPSTLKEYLQDFIKAHDNLGIKRNVTASDDASKINEYRLNACRAVESMFFAEYPYSLSPGKTPTNEDFVRYFLEVQKRGYCSHFASAGVMLLRTLGIPARYCEGYCIPESLLKEEGVRIEGNGEEWLEVESLSDPEKKIFSVEVSDYYAHAWVEVYLEGIGFVPYEVTPPSFEAAPGASAVSGIGRFFQNLFNVDLGIGDVSESSTDISGGEFTVTDAENGPGAGDIILIPLAMVVGAAAVFWLLFCLIRFVIRERRYARYLDNKDFKSLVYGRYMDFVRKMQRKHVVKVQNPLPMELSEILALHSAEKSENRTVSDFREEYTLIFGYAEKVLYSEDNGTAEEYEKFYAFIKQYA